MRVGGLEGRRDELRRVAVENGLLIIALLNQIGELLLNAPEVDRIPIDVLKEVLTRRLAIRIELDPAVLVIQVQRGIQGVIITLRGGGCFRPGVRHRFCQNVSNPSLTRSTSVGVPRSS